MANESVRPVLPQFFFKGPLGSWFQVPQLGRPPVPPFRQLKLGDRWRSMPRLPHLSIMMFPTILSGRERVGGLSTSDLFHDLPEASFQVGSIRWRKGNSFIQPQEPLLPLFGGDY